MSATKATMTIPDDPDTDRIWREHGPAALRYATVLVGPDDAHDVTVNAFLRVTRSTGWASVTNQRAYFMRAVTNHAHDLRRRRERQWRRDLAAVGPASTPGPDSHVDLHRKIAELSVQQRAVVYLTYWEDMTLDAIADLLGLSTGTVHRNLARARARLREALS